VLKNLGLPEDGSSMRNLHSVCVAPHHWTYAQLEYFDTNNSKPSTTYLTRSETEKIAHFTDENASFSDEQGNRLMLQIPNYPKDWWEEDGKTLLGGRHSRVQRRTDAVVAAERREKRSNRQKEIANEKEQRRMKQEKDNSKKTWEWQAEVNGLAENLESANAAVEAKDAEVANLEKKLEETTKTLTSTKRKLDRARKRKAEHPPNSAGDSANNVVVISVADVLSLVGKLINKWGGVSRLSLLNETWHSQHDDAANILFGFQTWNEVIGYIESLFPDVNTNLKGKIAHYKGSGVVIVPTELTPFERCLENPDDYIALGYHHGAALKDGKDFASQYKRSDSSLQ